MTGAQQSIPDDGRRQNSVWPCPALPCPALPRPRPPLALPSPPQRATAAAGPHRAEGFDMGLRGGSFEFAGEEALPAQLSFQNPFSPFHSVPVHISHPSRTTPRRATPRHAPPRVCQAVHSSHRSGSAETRESRAKHCDTATSNCNVHCQK